MEPFRTHAGHQAVYNEDNVDTDRIIPARYLSRVSRSGYGDLLFKDVRGADFPLDRPEAQGATVLTVGTNFGCGSSREHAVWAIQQAGFRAVVARRGPETPGFSDIFRQNAANCGLLLIELDEDDHRELVATGSGAQVEVDLENQKVRSSGRQFAFEIGEMTKRALLEGLDLIGTTLVYQERIGEYESEHEDFLPR
jgi:3-isopropylmalate/(R)-2-methylmalate dehydratase small subunit